MLTSRVHSQQQFNVDDGDLLCKKEGLLVMFEKRERERERDRLKTVDAKQIRRECKGFMGGGLALLGPGETFFCDLRQNRP